MDCTLIQGDEEERKVTLCVTFSCASLETVKALQERFLQIIFTPDHSKIDSDCNEKEEEVFFPQIFQKKLIFQQEERKGAGSSSLRPPAPSNPPHRLPYAASISMRVDISHILPHTVFIHLLLPFEPPSSSSSSLISSEIESALLLKKQLLGLNLPLAQRVISLADIITATRRCSSLPSLASSSSCHTPVDVPVMDELRFIMPTLSFSYDTDSNSINDGGKVSTHSSIKRLSESLQEANQSCQHPSSIPSSSLFHTSSQLNSTFPDENISFSDGFTIKQREVKLEAVSYNRVECYPPITALQINVRSAELAILPTIHAEYVNTLLEDISYIEEDEEEDERNEAIEFKSSYMLSIPRDLKELMMQTSLLIQNLEADTGLVESELDDRETFELMEERTRECFRLYKLLREKAA